MIEVFKTDVVFARDAALIIQLIERMFPHYIVNFDLADCDNILRISAEETFYPETIIDLLKNLGFSAEVLADEIMTVL